MAAGWFAFANGPAAFFRKWRGDDLQDFVHGNATAASVD
jgi:hypothetical protein